MVFVQSEMVRLLLIIIIKVPMWGFDSQQDSCPSILARAFATSISLNLS